MCVQCEEDDDELYDYLADYDYEDDEDADDEEAEW